MKKRIVGIGTLDGTALTLTHAATVACGHLLADGVDGGDVAREARRAARETAQQQADDMGKSVEIYATAPDAQDWVVDVVEPTVLVTPEFKEIEKGGAPFSQQSRRRSIEQQAEDLMRDNDRRARPLPVR